MTTHTTTMNALFITEALSMVMAMGHISRVTLTPQNGTTMVVVMVINYLYLIQYMLASWAKYIICYATLY